MPHGGDFLGLRQWEGLLESFEIIGIFSMRTEIAISGVVPRLACLSWPPSPPSTQPLLLLKL